MMMVWSRWTSSAQTWPQTLNLCGPKTTKKSQMRPALPWKPKETSNFQKTVCVFLVWVVLQCSYSCNAAMCPLRSKATFKTPAEDDLGIYSCLVTHTDGASSSYTLSAEGESHSVLLLTWGPFLVGTVLSVTVTPHPGTAVFWLFQYIVILGSCRGHADMSTFLAELKKLLEISHDHKFPSECLTFIHPLHRI